MTDLPNEQSGLFDAFLGAAQYIARIKRQEDLWAHAGRFIVAHFPAEWVAFAQKGSQGEISVQSCTSSDPSLNLTLVGPEVTALVADVLETGFLASEVLHATPPAMTALMPVMEEYQTRAVMLVGHTTVRAISADLLNVYLALAGLVGTAWERLRNEQELTKHRVYLEELVGERTRELRETQEQTELILHSVGEGICGLDLEGRITFVNQFAAESLGWDPVALLGRDAHGTFHHARPGGRPYPVDGCSVRALMMGELTGPVSGEHFLRQDGTPIPVEFSTAPITRDGTTTGAVLVFRDITERLRAEEERERLLARQQELGEELAAVNGELQAQNDELRTAHADAARLLEEQRALLHRLQVALLDIPQQLSGVRFGHLYRSATKEAEVGGDFYDVFEAKNGRVGLLIGDVSGHGVDAARVATLVKDTVRAFSHQFRRPHLVLRETNRLLVEKHLPGFTTAFLGFLDPIEGRLVYSCAGHPPPLLMVGGAVTLLESPNVPLGAFASAHYRDSEVEIPGAGRLLLYTDGITEARKGDAFFGEADLVKAFIELSDHAVETLPSQLLQAVLAFSEGGLDDDVALLAVNLERRAPGEKAD